jgi:hypothetical protein
MDLLSDRVMAEARRLLAMGGVETRGRRPKPDPKSPVRVDPEEPRIAWPEYKSGIPWKVYDQAFRKLYPRGLPRTLRSNAFKESEILQAARQRAAENRLSTRRYNNEQRGSTPYEHLAIGSKIAHKKRIAFLAKVAICSVEVANGGKRVTAKAVVRKLELMLNREGVSVITVQRALRDIRLGLVTD